VTAVPASVGGYLVTRGKVNRNGPLSGVLGYRPAGAKTVGGEGLLGTLGDTDKKDGVPSYKRRREVGN